VSPQGPQSWRLERSGHSNKEMSLVEGRSNNKDKVHKGMKTYWGSGGIAARILDHRTRWR
jgi:hypothetical protein